MRIDLSYLPFASSSPSNNNNSSIRYNPDHNKNDRRYYNNVQKRPLHSHSCLLPSSLVFSTFRPSLVFLSSTSLSMKALVSSIPSTDSTPFSKSSNLLSPRKYLSSIS